MKEILGRNDSREEFSPQRKEPDEKVERQIE